MGKHSGGVAEYRASEGKTVKVPSARGAAAHPARAAVCPTGQRDLAPSICPLADTSIVHIMPFF